jgi:hypothetical protein
LEEVLANASQPGTAEIEMPKVSIKVNLEKEGEIIATERDGRKFRGLRALQCAIKKEDTQVASRRTSIATNVAKST